MSRKRSLFITLNIINKRNAFPVLFFLRKSECACGNKVLRLLCFLFHLIGIVPEWCETFHRSPLMA